MSFLYARSCPCSAVTVREPPFGAPWRRLTVREPPLTVARPARSARSVGARQDAHADPRHALEEDFPLGTVDASVVALAERLDTDLVATLARRHFGAVRPRHCRRFELLPE